MLSGGGFAKAADRCGERYDRAALCIVFENRLEFFISESLPGICLNCYEYGLRRPRQKLFP